MNQFEALDGGWRWNYGWRTPMDEPLVFDEPQTYTGDARPLTQYAHV